MPGVHTFYDGSKLLEPFADVVGVEVDKINLVACQFTSIVAAIAYYQFCKPETVSRNVRLAFPLVVGLAFCFFCYGRAIKHLLGVIGVCYALMRFSPPRFVHKLVFVFALGYLFFIHWYRFYILSTYSIDVTGAMMVLVQKVTTLAFSLHDGRVKKKEELNEIQKREAIERVPEVLDYLAYCFHFQTVLTGPLCFYTDFQKFISGENTRVNGKIVATPWVAASQKLFVAGICLLAILFISPNVQPEILADGSTQYMGVISWSLLWFFSIFMQRVQYYYAWVLADAICNFSGFGFNGFDEQGNEKWDLVSNVQPLKVEMALSFKETLDAWNITTMYWLRRVAYDRVPKNLRTVSTYLLSAMWHGFFMGYYITFLTGALVTVSARTIRRCLRWRFQNSESNRRLYDVITFLATKFALAYTTYPFVTMHLNPGLQIYKQTFFILHVLCILSLTALPMVLPPERKPKKEEPVASVTGQVVDAVYGEPVGSKKSD